LYLVRFLCYGTLCRNLSNANAEVDIYGLADGELLDVYGAVHYRQLRFQPVWLKTAFKVSFLGNWIGYASARW